MYILPENLRNELKQDIDLLLKGKKLIDFLKKEKKIVSIGDRVTYTILKNNIEPIFCIVDYILERKEYGTDMKNLIQKFGKNVIKVNNPPGQISDELWNSIEYAYEKIDKGPFRIEVTGEEDLASLVAIYLAPRGVTVIYGMPNKGVVIVRVNDNHKNIVKEILEKCDRNGN